MTSPDERINATVLVQRCVYNNKKYLGIISYLAQMDANKEGSTTLFINNLEIAKVFKDEDEEKGVSVTDFIN